MSMWPILLQPLLLLLLAWIGLRHVLARPPGVSMNAFLPVTLIMPLTGDNALIRQGLDTLLNQSPAPARIVLAVWDEADPAYLLARELAARHPHADVALGHLVPAASRKNAKLLAGVAAADPGSAGNQPSYRPCWTAGNKNWLCWKRPPIWTRCSDKPNWPIRRG